MWPGYRLWVWPARLHLLVPGVASVIGASSCTGVSSVVGASVGAGGSPGKRHPLAFVVPGPRGPTPRSKLVRGTVWAGRPARLARCRVQRPGLHHCVPNATSTHRCVGRDQLPFCVQGLLTAPRKADLGHGISGGVQYSVVERRWKIDAKNTSTTKPTSLGVSIGSVTGATISGDESW